ncbi:hypothetical protein AYJ57_20895 (plasmid) [Salipiger sp. CCB-MM3]|uniref:hypothetical protein n=1 Tax=Salipiger sp. CCB-MM3 TaxID=1792508 RepID=UPI00080AB7CD|nr:hypothetical protein [Salipiger sp. CCB-MM3]ANT62938.1 hypothetical protein AYJ57_20895 [Salipiger sp. CCB-MM3]
MSDYIRELAIERGLRANAEETTGRLLKEDLDEAMETGLMSREEVADLAMRTVLAWKSAA